MSHFVKFKTVNILNKESSSKLLDTDGPVVQVPEVKIQKEIGTNRKVRSDTKQERANNLSLIGAIPESAVEYSNRIDFAEKQKYKNKWYQFILKVAAFSTEKIDKLWNKDLEKESTRSAGQLTNERPVAAVASIEAASRRYAGSSLVRDEVDAESVSRAKNIADYVGPRSNFLNAPEIRAEIFLSASAYGHIIEARDLIQNHCNVSLTENDLVFSAEHSTYFARLTAIRIQLSRFLSGRYYSLSANYGRLMNNQSRLIRYFKNQFNSSSSRPIKRYRLTNDLHRNGVMADFRNSTAVSMPQSYTSQLLGADFE
tara:strand:- start:59382 stop:60320 length:939 start_codon:yes stop_codon:yes gene_type:complete